MKYNNGREAQVGDVIVCLANQRAGVVSRVDGEKLQFLSFKECRPGEPYTLIPVTVQGKHWEPLGFEVPSETCVRVEDAGEAGANLAREELQATMDAVSKQVADQAVENSKLKMELEDAKNELIATEKAAQVALTARSERIAQLEAELAAVRPTAPTWPTAQNPERSPNSPSYSIPAFALEPPTEPVRPVAPAATVTTAEPNQSELTMAPAPGVEIMPPVANPNPN